MDETVQPSNLSLQGVAPGQKGRGSSTPQANPLGDEGAEGQEFPTVEVARRAGTETGPAGARGTHIDVSQDDALAIGVEEIIALGVSTENLGDAPFHLGKAGEHLLWEDTNAGRCMRGDPGLRGPGESQSVSAGGPRPVTCCRLRARPADFLVGGGGGQAPGSRSPARPAHSTHSGVPGPHPTAVRDPSRARLPTPTPEAGGRAPRPTHSLISYGILAHLLRRRARMGPRSGRARGRRGRRRRACRARRGRSEARLRDPLTPALSARCRCGRPNPEARSRRGSPPALTIYSQALGSAAAAPRACADTAPPLVRPRPGSDAKARAVKRRRGPQWKSADAGSLPGFTSR